MNNKIIIRVYLLFLLSSCTSCKDDNITNKDVIWKNRICGKSMIYDIGIGYPVYKNTVVFHSTPEPWGVQQSILHGLDIKTGKEKWRLANADFAPKKDLRFICTFGTYQKENIVVACDDVYASKDEQLDKYERYIYGIDIEGGKVLWIKPFPNEYRRMGNMVRGAGKYAYVNANNFDKFSLLRVNIQTGELSSAINLNNDDLPEEIRSKNPNFFNCFFTPIYQNSNGDDIVACSLSSQTTESPNDLLTTLYVYNLTQNAKIYSTSVSLTNGSNSWINYHNGKIIIGKYHSVYCFDAFENKKYWEKSIILNDGVGSGSGNNQIMQVLGDDNLALVYCVDRLVCFDINTGDLKYNVLSSHSIASVVDDVIYNEDNNDLVMRDVYTGKVLKRLATGKNEEGFASTRPNVVDGKVFIHNGTDAYCIKAWGK
jgi:hypothetical protein